MNSFIKIKPVGKYINKSGEEGIRYVWKIDDKDDYFVESGAFLRRTKLGKGTHDEIIRAYTTSVSLGCLLSVRGHQCKFCVTGNSIPFSRLLTSQEIALQNIYMILDDQNKNFFEHEREFAYMGQGEPSFSYKMVKEAIIGTDVIVKKLGSKTYRHIFATCGNPHVIKKLAQDIADGDFGDTRILLHLSIHSVSDRDRIMPINKIFPLKKVIVASEEFARVTGEKVVVNFLMFKEALLSNFGPFTTAAKNEINSLINLLNPKFHRVILCEYNPSCVIGNNGIIDEQEIERFKNMLERAGFEVKKFISFGREDKLACGLLGGRSLPNLNEDDIKFKLQTAMKMVQENVKNFDFVN